VLLDTVSTPQGINNKFESLSHDMPFLFSLLSFTRGLLAFGDLWLLLLGGFLMIAVRLAARALVDDRDLRASRRVSNTAADAPRDKLRRRFHAQQKKREGGNNRNLLIAPHIFSSRPTMGPVAV
jgi:hypothetical protein